MDEIINVEETIAIAKAAVAKARDKARKHPNADPEVSKAADFCTEIVIEIMRASMHCQNAGISHGAFFSAAVEAIANGVGNDPEMLLKYASALMYIARRSNPPTHYVDAVTTPGGHA